MTTTVDEDGSAVDEKTGNGKSRGVICADPLPPEHEQLTRQDTMRTLGVSHTKLAELTTKGDLRAWRVGRDAVYERAEVEAIAGRDGQAGLLRAATALVSQAQSHQQATLGVMMQAAQGLAAAQVAVLDKLLARNEHLESRHAEMVDKIAAAEHAETEQLIRLQDAEASAEQKKALLRAGERALPVLLARLSAGSPAEDAAVAAAIRALVADDDLLARMRAGLTDEQRASVDILVRGLRPKPTPTPGG